MEHASGVLPEDRCGSSRSNFVLARARHNAWYIKALNIVELLSRSMEKGNSYPQKN